MRLKEGELVSQPQSGRARTRYWVSRVTKKAVPSHIQATHAEPIWTLPGLPLLARSQDWFVWQKVYQMIKFENVMEMMDTVRKKNIRVDTYPQLYAQSEVHGPW